MENEEKYYEFNLKMKIFSIYLIIIIFSFYLAFFTGGITIIITLPLAIIVSNKITEKSRKKLKRLNTINWDYNKNQILSRIQTNKKVDVSSLNLVETLDKVDINDDNTLSSDYLEINSQVDYKKYYRAKRYVISLNELHFYEVLQEIAQELDLVLFCQVALYSIIEPKRNLDYSTKTKFLNKINRKSIDFVLVDKRNCRIKLCIELDDSTHKRRKRIERDNFLNELFEQLDVNLLRYPTYSVYYKEPLKKQILENMKENYYVD